MGFDPTHMMYNYLQAHETKGGVFLSSVNPTLLVGGIEELERLFCLE